MRGGGEEGAVRGVVAAFWEGVKKLVRLRNLRSILLTNFSKLPKFINLIKLPTKLHPQKKLLAAKTARRGY